MWTDEGRIIKQDSPENILWRLFRMEVEKQIFPEKFLRENIIEKGDNEHVE